MYRGTIKVCFWFAPMSINKVNKQNLTKHNLPQLYMHLSLTVYTMMLTKMFFFSEKELSYMFVSIFNTTLDVVLYVNLTDGRLNKTSVRISSVIVGMRLSLF